jgi:Tfp pilus assembly PilM family ATPase
LDSVAEPNDKTNLFVAVHPDHLSAIETSESAVRAAGWTRLQPECDLEAFRSGDAVVGRLADAFAEVRDSMHSSGSAASLVLSGSMVLIKKIPVALGLGDDVVQAQMRWEAEQVLLSPAEEFVLSHQRLPFSTPSGNPQYIQVLVRKRVVQLLRAFAKAAGISIREIDVDCFGDVRVADANYDLDEKGTAVVADIRPGRLGFVLIHRREFFLNSRVPIPREAAPAETAKILLKELRRLVFGHRGKGIDDLELLLLKGDGPLQAVAQEMKEQVPTEILDPFRRIAVSPEAKKTGGFERDAGRFTAPVGLALKRIPTLKAHSQNAVK